MSPAGKAPVVWSELVQLKLNIGASDGDSTPSEEKRGTPTYRSGGLKKNLIPLSPGSGYGTPGGVPAGRLIKKNCPVDKYYPTFFCNPLSMS